MAEYIEREIAKKAFQDMDSGRRDGWTTSLSPEEAADYLAEYLDDIPTADVAPVVHEEWIHLGGDEWCCSACGFVITTEGSWDKPTKKYCEDCGAKMDGGEENNNG